MFAIFLLALLFNHDPGPVGIGPAHQAGVPSQFNHSPVLRDK